MLRYVEIEVFFCTLLWVLICKEFLSWIFSRVPCSLQCTRFTGTENTGGWQFPVVPRKKDRKVRPYYMGPGDWQWTFRVKVPCSLDMFGWKNMKKQCVHNVVFPSYNTVKLDKFGYWPWFDRILCLFHSEHIHVYICNHSAKIVDTTVRLPCAQVKKHIYCQHWSGIPNS